MIIIHPSGSVEERTYTDYESIAAATNTGSDYDAAFTSVPVIGGQSCGYFVAANDDGQIINLQRNPLAERITGYPELYGSVVFSPYEECDETDLLRMVDPACRAHLAAKLQDALAASVARGT